VLRVGTTCSRADATRPQAREGVHLPRQRHLAQGVHSVPSLCGWCRPHGPGKAVQGYSGCVPSSTLRRSATEHVHRDTGRWPEKSVKFLLGLLKNAESNADAKNLDLEDLTVKNIVVQQAPVRSSALLFSPSCLTHLALLLENPPPHLPRARSHQPVPGPPRAHRDLPHRRRFRGRARDGQGRGRAYARRSQPQAGRTSAYRGWTRVRCRSRAVVDTDEGRELLRDMYMTHYAETMSHAFSSIRS
jgi:hypothetical protein